MVSYHVKRRARDENIDDKFTPYHLVVCVAAVNFAALAEGVYDPGKHQYLGHTACMKTLKSLKYTAVPA